MDKHELLRDILIEYNNPEYGDCIIDDICRLFKYPTTIDIANKK
jgi:hypothetical protein